MFKYFLIFIILVVLHGETNAVTSHSFQMDDGFQPTSGFYRNLDQVAQPSENRAPVVDRDEGNSIGGADQRTQRFGITTYGGTGVQGTYPTGSGNGIYGPMKIDLGGILLGSLIGLGAILILPKLINAFSYSYGGGYGRSIEEEMNAFAALLTKVEDTLEKSNVDSSSCAQRFTCSYVQSSLKNIDSGNATSTDNFIATMSSNSLVDYMLDGTAIKQAVETGKDTNTNCETLYPRCQLDKQTLMKIVSNAIPS